MSAEATPEARARPITIAVDAMGGDHAPAAVVEGAGFPVEAMVQGAPAARPGRGVAEEGHGLEGAA